MGLIHLSPFISLYLKLTYKVVKNGEKQFSYVIDLRPRSRSDIHLQYSPISINSIKCLHLPTLRLQAAKVFAKKSLFKLFPIQKPKL